MARRKTNSNLQAARTRMYRELVFESAEKVFAEQGFERATMQDIAAEAGISLKTLYGVFRGKQEIYREIGKLRGRQFLEHTVRAVQEGESVMDRMSRGVRAYVDFLVTHLNYFRLQLREGRGWGLDPANDSRGEWQSGLQMQAALLRQGIAEGVFHPGDPELMAATAIAIMQVQLAGLVERSGRIDAEKISDEILRQLRRYLCKTATASDDRRSLAI